MTGKEILGIILEDPCTHLQESIGDYIKDVVDQVLCEEVLDKIVVRRKLTEETWGEYNFYEDPMWKRAWNKKIREISKALKLK